MSLYYVAPKLNQDISILQKHQFVHIERRQAYLSNGNTAFFNFTLIVFQRILYFSKLLIIAHKTADMTDVFTV